MAWSVILSNVKIKFKKEFTWLNLKINYLEGRIEKRHCPTFC